MLIIPSTFFMVVCEGRENYYFLLFHDDFCCFSFFAGKIEERFSLEKPSVLCAPSLESSVMQEFNSVNVFKSKTILNSSEMCFAMRRATAFVHITQQFPLSMITRQSSVREKIVLYTDKRGKSQAPFPCGTCLLVMVRTHVS